MGRSETGKTRRQAYSSEHVLKVLQVWLVRPNVLGRKDSVKRKVLELVVEGPLKRGVVDIAEDDQLVMFLQPV